MMPYTVLKNLMAEAGLDFTAGPQNWGHIHVEGIWDK